MKKIIIIIFLFLSINLFSQEEPCQEFLDKMAEKVENNSIEEAKTFMKGFVTCKEENIDLNRSIINNLNQIDYIKLKLPNNFFSSKVK